MQDNPDPVIALSDEQCWERLGQQELGRLVTHVGDVLDIFPVNFIVDDESLLFRTAEGSKLFEIMITSEVLFEVDAYTDSEAWSVVVRGHARALDSSEDVERSDSLGLKPWIPTLKYVYVRILPDSLSGRLFHPAPEPDRYGIQQY